MERFRDNLKIFILVPKMSSLPCFRHDKNFPWKRTFQFDAFIESKLHAKKSVKNKLITVKRSDKAEFIGPLERASG